jgi:hypothetical protein
MSKERYSHQETTSHDSLYPKTWLSCWSFGADSWRFPVEKECFLESDRPIEKENVNSGSNTILFGILVSLFLLGAAGLSQVPRIAQTIEEAGTNSAKRMMLIEP